MRIVLGRDDYQLDVLVIQKVLDRGVMLALRVINGAMSFLRSGARWRWRCALEKGNDFEIGVGEDVW